LPSGSAINRVHCSKCPGQGSKHSLTFVLMGSGIKYH